MSNDDGMTPTEREQWLRDRGVQIESSADRRKAESALSGTDRPLSIMEQVQRLSLSDSTGENDVTDGVKFVYLPHDTAKPIKTVCLPLRLVDALGPAGDIIPTYIKSFFADGRSIDEKIFKDQAAKQNLFGGDVAKFAANVQKEKLATVSEGEQAAAKEEGENPTLSSSALMNATAGGSVETFALVRPSKTNKNEGVYIYLDEVGMLKHLPLNTRASQLAQQCGYHPAPNFYGDVFVGRVSSKPMLHNIDIESGDIMDTTKEWMVRAPQENVLWQQAINEATGRSGETQPNHAGTEGVAAEATGKDGNSYSWLQNEEEIELSVPLIGDGDEKVNKSLIKVAFQPQKVIVKYNNECKVEVQLYSKIDVDGCTWTLDKKNLVITCEKARNGEIWPRLELSG
ncbi:hypothetical protein ACHAXM_009342 [Skeletonema potamos]|jgi:hypothetical protein